MSHNRITEGSSFQDAMVILARIIVRAYNRNAALARFFESPFYTPAFNGARVYTNMPKCFRWFTRDEEGNSCFVTATLCS